MQLHASWSLTRQTVFMVSTPTGSISDLAAKGWQPCSQVHACNTASSPAHTNLSCLLNPVQSLEPGESPQLRRLEDLLMLIARSHSREEPSGQASQSTSSSPQAAVSTPAALVVGHLMKPSRERDLASRGLLPLVPQHGISFVPIDTALLLEQQGPFDALLHKVSRGREPLAASCGALCRPGPGRVAELRRRSAGPAGKHSPAAYRLLAELGCRQAPCCGCRQLMTWSAGDLGSCQPFRQEFLRWRPTAERTPGHVSSSLWPCLSRSRTNHVPNTLCKDFKVLLLSGHQLLVIGFDHAPAFPGALTDLAKEGLHGAACLPTSGFWLRLCAKSAPLPLSATPSGKCCVFTASTGAGPASHVGTL